MPKRFSKPAGPSSGHNSGPSSGPSQRQLRAGELIRHVLVEIFQREDLRDPALQGVSLTISEVRAAPDLKTATVYCAPLGATVGAGENGAAAGEETDPVIAALNRLSAHLRGLLGRRIELKFTPALTFKRDESFAEARRIDELLASPAVKRDLGGEH